MYVGVSYLSCIAFHNSLLLYFVTLHDQVGRTWQVHWKIVLVKNMGVPILSMGVEYVNINSVF